MKVTPSLKASLRTSLQHLTQFPDLRRRFNVLREELATLGYRLYSYGNSAPPHSKLYQDIWALRNIILGHRSAMKTLVIEMNDVYKSGCITAAQAIFAIREGELLRNGSPELEALVMVTGFDAKWGRVNGMWNEAMGFSAQVDYLGNCCP
ncbi:hypothetical protein FMEXI_14379 [Fusarium mexicanum]|uniref:Uncharacterized protein n=1 Tax=Fusarium mexicanum TaxID=751941 RepID=A0A8H5I347_9HYPO|nr:hypothetical protein FMEXI_14379 [Fusarium mexicanum]